VADGNAVFRGQADGDFFKHVHASVLNPKFASFCSTFRRELRIQEDTRKL
jgi:hypothetical protein